MFRRSLLVLLLLAGCAQSPQRPALEHAEAGQQSFVLDGRLAVRHGSQSVSTGLHWEHRPQQDDVLLLAPLGQTVGRIHRDTQGAELDTSDKHYQAADLESLMERVLGWHLPLEELHAWARGVPYQGGTAEVQRNALGQVESLTQDGWQISYPRHAGDQPDSLPAMLVMEYQDMRLRLVVDSWGALQ